MATSKIISTPTAWTRPIRIDATSVPDDLTLLSFPSGVYVVSGDKSDYIPFRYGTLVLFKANFSTTRYTLAIAKEAESAVLYVRHGHGNGWHAGWMRYTGTTVQTIYRAINEMATSTIKLENAASRTSEMTRLKTPSRADTLSLMHFGKVYICTFNNVAYSEDFSSDTAILNVPVTPLANTRFILVDAQKNIIIGNVISNGNILISGYLAGHLLYGTLIFMAQ